MSGNTINTQHCAVSDLEKVGDNTVNALQEDGGQVVADEPKDDSNNIGRDAEPMDIYDHPTGGLKAWLYVLATFFIFISAW